MRAYNVGRGHNDVLRGPNGRIIDDHPNTPDKLRIASSVYLQASVLICIIN